jgi:amino acid permease
MCFTVNYIMGTGFLTLPLAFSEAGLLLSLLMLGVVCYASDVSKNYVLEAMARAEALSQAEGGSATERSAILPGESDKKNSDQPEQMVKARKFEIVEMCSMFLGSPARAAYMVTLALYMFGTLWVYTTVFGHAMSTTISLTGAIETDYLIWVAVFAAVVVPLTCMELREQVGVQVILSLARFVMVILMVSTTAAAMTADDEQFDHQTCAKGVPLFNFAGAYKMLPVAVYANIYHHSIPGLSLPVGDKSKLGTIFGTTFVFGMFAYSLIGGTVSWYFGDGVNVKGANINWSDYHAGTGHIDEISGLWVDKAFWAQAISAFVVCFPAMDVVSAFPLNGITLGNNLMVMYYGDEISQYENDKSVTNMFRLSVAVPPVLCACVWNDINKVTDYTGITGFLIAFTFPAALHYYSRRAAIARGLSGETIYSQGCWSGDVMTIAIGAFGLFLVVFVFGSLIMA